MRCLALAPSSLGRTGVVSTSEATNSIAEAGWHGRCFFSGSNLLIDFHWEGDESMRGESSGSTSAAPYKHMLLGRALRGEATLWPTGDVVRVG